MNDDIRAAREAVAARRAQTIEQDDRTAPMASPSTYWQGTPSSQLDNSPHPQPYPSRIDANVPAGVHQQSHHSAVAPFIGGHTLPTGQTINVSMNAPSNILPFKEWMLRGVVGGVGRGAAWPFKLVALTAETIVTSAIDVLKSVFKFAAFALLVPALLVVGVRLASHVNQAPSLEAAAHGISQDSRHAAKGLVDGATDHLQSETGDNPAPRHHAHRDQE